MMFKTKNGIRLENKFASLIKYKIFNRHKSVISFLVNFGFTDRANMLLYCMCTSATSIL